MIECKEAIEEITANRALIREAILNEISGSKNRLTPKELEKRLSQRLSFSRTAVKAAIRHLVEARELVYSYHFGCSFLEKAFNKPTRISKRIVIKPPDIRYVPQSNEVVIDILAGASFGIGEHPTTRLAVRGIEQALSHGDFPDNKSNPPALDIGTGSGILAIVTAVLGNAWVLGIDIDPCAVMEAKNNAQLNNLEHRIEICDRRIETIDQMFALITANLRYPTIRRLAQHMATITQTKGAFVVSGIKTEEAAALVDHYKQHHFQCLWQENELGWAGLVLERISCKSCLKKEKKKRHKK